MLTNALNVLGILLSVVFLVWFFISDKHFSKIAVLFMDAVVIILSIGTITAGLFLRNQSLNEDMRNEIEGQEEIPSGIEETDGEDPVEDPGALSFTPLEDDREPLASPSEEPLGGDNGQDTENGEENKAQTESRPTATTQPPAQDTTGDNGESQGTEATENASAQPQPTGGEGIPAQPAAEENAAGTEGGGTGTGQENTTEEENSQSDGAAQTEQNVQQEGNGQESSDGQAADESHKTPEAGQPGDTAMQEP